ncbi:Site-specific recombinase XerD [Pedobacter steynii]|uniref:Site-specific recombinase XerD n=1 Tax=Pedobacter steynii TaxID=430522 RepID=A0A1G9K0I0_9SPHI|nr:site-specific integrase [Pedobacter steynii]NQX38411.1 tyrosine-type recombinase/integrase [Pedobacter steynii]SDL43288.1 Site-specific recombinase XerD [Pedobacter steynii]
MVSQENKNKKNPILRTWNNYEFRLYVPKNISKDNKIEVHFSYLNPATGKEKQIKRSNGIDRYAKPKIYTEQANKLIEVLIDLIKSGWDPINKTLPGYKKLTGSSTMQECIESWLKVRDGHFEDKKIQKGELNSTKNVFNLFTKFLVENELYQAKPSYFTVNDIDQFMRYIEKAQNLGKASYNSYLSRLTYFFDFLIIERLIVFSPTKGAHRYSTKNLETRYKIYEDDELKMVKDLLTTDPNFNDLLVAANLLYSYRIRGKEQLRIKMSFFDFEHNLLTFPVEVMERGRMINATKNGNPATFLLSENIMTQIKGYLGDAINKPDFYLFGGKNQPGPNQRFESYFSNKFAYLRRKYNLSSKLKFYALKHTSNYNSYESIGIEKLSKVNRHASISQTQDYIKSKLKKEIISVRSETEF